jgi:hypothetical protein
MSDKIIDRIKKLLAMSNGKGTTPEEAAAFAAEAQRMLAQHGLDLATVEASGGTKASDSDGPIGEHEHERATRSKVVWMGRLAHGIALAGGGDMYWQTAWTTQGRLIRAVFIGTPSQVAAWSVMYNFLLDEIDRLARIAVAKLPPYEPARNYGNSFRLGATAVVTTRLHAIAQEQRRGFEARIAEEQQKALATGSVLTVAPGQPTALAPSIASSALVLVDRRKAEVEQFVKNLGLKKGRATKGASHFDGYHDGRKAGEGIHLGGKLPSAAGNSSQARLR